MADDIYNQRTKIAFLIISRVKNNKGTVAVSEKDIWKNLYELLPFVPQLPSHALNDR